MSIVTMSILGSMLAALIVAFIVSLFFTEKVDLEGRIKKSQVDELVAGDDPALGVTDTRYGNFYRHTIRPHINESTVQKVAKLMGVDLRALQESIELAGLKEKTSAEELASMKFLGISGAFLFGSFGIITQDLLYMAAAVTIFVAGFILPLDRIKGAIKKRNNDVMDELPGFVERTYMCMESGANLRQALEIVAQKSGGVLGQEFMQAFVLAGYGTGWEKELELMASRIQVEPLQDFIVDIITANAKGVSVTDTLKEEAEHINNIRRSNTLMAIGPLETQVMLLVMVFSLLPTMGILLLPVLINSLAVL